MNETTLKYLREMSPQLLRRTLYDSRRMIREASRHPNDPRSPHIIRCNEAMVPACESIASERGIKVKAST